MLGQGLTSRWHLSPQVYALNVNSALLEEFYEGTTCCRMEGYGQAAISLWPAHRGSSPEGAAIAATEGHLFVLYFADYDGIDYDFPIIFLWQAQIATV